jgi:hypothetical protein
MVGIVVGGDSAWKVRTQKGLVVAFHWVNGEPALCLAPLRRRLGAGAFIIGMSHAYKYARRDGYPTSYCMRQAFAAANVMAMDTTKATIQAIVETILDHIEDLVKMPPEPPKKDTGTPLGEIALFHDGQKVAEDEVTVPHDTQPEDSTI